MAALGQGTLVAGRYQLIEPLTSDVVGIERWLANDQVLERDVFVFTFNTGRQAAALDSARRASLVHDERLVRVVDAGEFEDVPYMITTKPKGKTLFEIVTDHSPLSADQARAIIGEASEALESARRRGVNHLVLRPSNIYRLDSSEIVISGLGYEGALLGLDTAAPLVTARTDAMGLVANLYFALTGRWPGTLPPGVDSSKLEQAPVVSGSPVAPTELMAGIPNDLDTLCAVTFGPNHDGPHSAADLARDLEPWGEISTEDHLIMSDEAAPQPEHAPPPPTPPQPQRQSFRDRIEPRTPTGGTAARPVGPAAGGAFAGGVSGAASGSSPRSVPPTQNPSRPGGPGPVNNAQRAQSGPPTGATPTGGTPRRVNALPLSGQGQRPPQGTFVRGQHPPSHRPTGAAAMATSGAGGSPGSGSGSDKDSVNLTPFIFGFVGLLVLIGVVLAFNTLKSSSSADDQMAQQSPTPEVPAPETSDDESEEPEPEETEEEEDEDEEEEAKPAFIDSVEALDPDGDGEHPEDQHKAIDGESDTFWSSRWYNEADMPGKSGIGLAVTLEEKSEFSSVEIATNGEGGKIEIRNTDNEDPSGGKLLDSGSVDGTTTFDFDAVETDTFVIWVTELPVDPEGENRIAISDIVVS